jgi:hypothetical protein
MPQAGRPLIRTRTSKSLGSAPFASYERRAQTGDSRSFAVSEFVTLANGEGNAAPSPRVHDRITRRQARPAKARRQTTSRKLS